MKHRRVTITFEVEDEVGDIWVTRIHHVEPDPTDPDAVKMEVVRNDDGPPPWMPARLVASRRLHVDLHISGTMKPTVNGECYHVNHTPAGAVLASD